MRSTILAFLLAATAFAQSGEVSVSMGKSSMRNNPIVNDTSAGVASIGTNFHMGIRLTINQWKFMGHEIGYGYNHGSLSYSAGELGMSIHQGVYNFLAYATPEGSRIRPFATGGVHFSSFRPSGSSGVATKFGYNYGGGIKVKVKDSWLVRFDVRDYATGKPDFFGVSRTSGPLRQLVVSAGVGFGF